MLEDSIIYRLEVKVADMKDPGLKSLADIYLNEARNHEGDIVALSTTISRTGYATELWTIQMRHHIDSMHSALRCVRAQIKADREAVQD